MIKLFDFWFMWQVWGKGKYKNLVGRDGEKRLLGRSWRR